jgi:hypothetical protein
MLPGSIKTVRRRKNEKEDMVEEVEEKKKSNKCVSNTNDAARPFIIPSVLNTSKPAPFCPTPLPPFPETIYRTFARLKQRQIVGGL